MKMEISQVDVLQTQFLIALEQPVFHDNALIFFSKDFILLYL